MSMRPVTDPEDGFIATDAMVGLAILATVIVLALAAWDTAGRISEAAAETQKANGELRYLLASAPRYIGVTSGKSANFDWQVSTQPEDAARSATAPICRRTAEARSRASGRRFVLATAEFCLIG